MFEFSHIKERILRKFGEGWTIGFTTGRDKYPTATLNCPICKQVVPHVSGIQGFAGIPPKAGCFCKEPIPYPIQREEFAAHLNAKPKLWQGEAPKQPVYDSWEGVSGEFKYERWNGR